MGGSSRRTLAAIWTGLAVAGSAEASPWVRDPGRLFVSTRSDYFSAQASDPLPGAAIAARFERFDTTTYAELGLFRWLMIGGKAVYATASYDDGINASAGAGFSEFEGFAQREIWRNSRDVFALRVAGGSTAGLDDGGRPGLVSDGVDLELRALYGRNLTQRPFKTFAAAEIAYRRRFGDGADQARADFLVGAEPFKGALLLLEVFATASLRNEAMGGADYDVVKIQPSLAWRVSRRWTLQGGVTHEAWGRNLLNGNAYFIGLWTTF